MRTAWLVPLLSISLLPACSDDDGDDNADDNAAGRAGSNAGGSAGGAAGGAGGAAGRSGLAGAAGSAMVGSSGAAGSAGSGGEAGASGAAGAAGSSASGATGCEGLCARPLVCPGGTRAECVSSCEDSAELCPEQSEALLECGESLSDDDFQCVGDATIPNDDLCVPESLAFGRCVIGF